ncbi:MAG: hypothetical protein JOZ24_08705, partial [Candidatus Eremiobacteraeota bacterium]|nr:hypothetical protein [Candidatus Eremiobacteraeota bacterium]
PPKSAANVIVASNIGRIGKEADADDLEVIRTGRPRLEFNATHDRYSVEEPLLDVSGAVIGALGVSFPYASGADLERDRQTARDVQRFFAKHVISAANLMDPYPYSTAYSPDNAAQALVDATIAHHPELLVLGMHVTLAHGGNVFLGSNIGRIGKLADDDDMRVVNTERANHEVSEDGRRYEVELVLLDAARRNIGALGVVFRYAASTDRAALNARADAIRDEMAARIASPEALLAHAGQPLVANGTTDVPGYRGDFDHFAADVNGGRLFLAGEDGAALEVFDLASGALRASIGGFGVPHSMLLLPGANELVVVDGSKPAQVRDATSLALKRSFRLPAGADSSAYDGATKHLWVVTGGKDVPLAYCDLLEIDPANGKVFRTVRIDDAHVEGIAVEAHGRRLFVNVTGKNRIDVFDKVTGSRIASWPVTAAKQNAPMALDEPNHRVFIVTRDPGMLLVIDSQTGRFVASLRAPEHADQVLWDDIRKRAYVPGGDGFLGIYQRTAGDHYLELPRIATAPGAKTGLLVRALDRLYLAASPGDSRVGGAVLRYDLTP